MSRFEVLHVNIASGASLSGEFKVQGAKTVGIFAAVPTSCQAFLQVGYASGNLTRVNVTNGSSNWAWNIGSGDGAVDLKDSGVAFPFCRLETVPAQTDTASIAVVMKL